MHNVAAALDVIGGHDAVGDPPLVGFGCLNVDGGQKGRGGRHAECRVSPRGRIHLSPTALLATRCILHLTAARAGAACVFPRALTIFSPHDIATLRDAAAAEDGGIARGLRWS
ncbi:hypothetical protein BST61_g8800 [Cercospora zeina]